MSILGQRNRLSAKSVILLSKNSTWGLLEKLPPTAFGRTLRTMIRENWATQASFAEKVAVDNSWITKVIRGDQESLTYSSLQKLLSGISRPIESEELYEAWLETYAPSPIDRKVPTQWSTDEQIIQYAASVHDLISAGKVLSTFQALMNLWRHLEQRPDRDETALDVGHALVHAANQLDRVGVSLRISDAMVKRAVSVREPAWTAISLWLRCVSLRHLRPRAIERVEASFNDFGRYLDDWQPASENGKKVRREIVQSFLRDDVLAGIDALKERKADSRCQFERIESLRSRAKEVESSVELGLAYEVLARALVATSRVEEAIEPLRMARKLAESNANQLKVQICRVQLLAADGQPQEAQAELDRAVEIADAFHLVHHRHKLATIEQDLRTESFRAYSFPGDLRIAER